MCFCFYLGERNVTHYNFCNDVDVRKVEVTGLPTVGVIKEQGVTVKGSGHCIIRDVSLEQDVVDKTTVSPAGFPQLERACDADAIYFVGFLQVVKTCLVATAVGHKKVVD